jgi:hypothetical protein
MSPVASNTQRTSAVERSSSQVGGASPTRAPAGFELGAGGREVVLHGDGVDSANHLDKVVNAGEDAVAVVLCHVADVLHEMRRGVSRIQNMFSKNVKNVGRRCV